MVTPARAQIQPARLNSVVREDSMVEGGPASRPGMRPASLSQYADLTQLRYDYPIVLVPADHAPTAVRSLRSVINQVLQRVAPRGASGERMRKHVLRLETEIRMQVAAGAQGRLSELWERAHEELLGRASADEVEGLRDSLGRSRADLAIDGEVVGCEIGAPERLVSHVWSELHTKARHAVAEWLNDLVLRLSDILRVDRFRSGEGLGPAELRRSVGTGDEDAFDFEAMSRVLRDATRQAPIPARRRERIEKTLLCLESQRFFGWPGANKPLSHWYGFGFSDCCEALSAYEDRRQEMVEFIKAVTVAELEIDNRYHSDEHDALLAKLDADGLAPGDLARFPSYLVCLREHEIDPRQRAVLMEVLASGLPFNILVQTDDLLAPPLVTGITTPVGGPGPRLASMVLGLGNVYILQSSGSDLYGMAEHVAASLGYGGPSLLSVFSGVAPSAGYLPPYMVAACATYARAFPAFAYDPRGEDWATRLRLDQNPQAAGDWCTHPFSYEDAGLQRVSENLTFTFADFLACDSRYAGHFTQITASQWHEGLVPVSQFLDLPPDQVGNKVPYVWIVDEDGRLYRYVADDAVIRAATRCREAWRSLQELGGINNSHAKRLLATQREQWQREKALELEALREELGEGATDPVAPTATDLADGSSSVTAVADGEPPAADEPSPGEPYIETSRCTSCDECTKLSPAMFSYDENKQAQLGDVKAGSYRELVEAAESCPVAIIHPGQPWDPDEPDLDDLIRRADAFT